MTEVGEGDAGKGAGQGEDGRVFGQCHSPIVATTLATVA